MATADAVIVIDVVSVSALRPQSVAIVLEVQAARSSWVAVSESRYDAGKRTWTALSLPVAYCRNALPSNRVLMRIVAKGALLGLQFGTALLSFDDLLAQPSHQLLLQDALGNPTSVGSPMVPCEVTVGASAASLQQHGYVVPRNVDKYPVSDRLSSTHRGKRPRERDLEENAICNFNFFENARETWTPKGHRASRYNVPVSFLPEVRVC